MKRKFSPNENLPSRNFKGWNGSNLANIGIKAREIFFKIKIRNHWTTRKVDILCDFGISS